MKNSQRLCMVFFLFGTNSYGSSYDFYDYDYYYDDSFENSRRKKGKMLLKMYRDNINKSNNLNKNHLRNGRKK